MKTKISPGQALLLLLEKYKDNDEKFNELKRHYLLGFSEGGSELTKLLTRYDEINLLKRISIDSQTIDRDPSRRYFETYLAYLTLISCLEQLDGNCLKKHYQSLINYFEKADECNISSNEKFKKERALILEGKYDHGNTYAFCNFEEDDYKTILSLIDSYSKYNSMLGDRILSKITGAQSIQGLKQTKFKFDEVVKLHSYLTSLEVERKAASSLLRKKLSVCPEYHDTFTLKLSGSIAQVDEDIAFKCLSIDSKTKAKYILKIHLLTRELDLFLKKKSGSGLPLDLYQTNDNYKEDNRGRKRKLENTSCVSTNKGILKSYMPSGNNDITRENKDVTFRRDVDRCYYVKDAQWPKKIFSFLVHPFVNSLSGTMLYHIRYMLKQAKINERAFPNHQAVCRYFQCLIALRLYNGGHSLFEYSAVFSLREIKEILPEITQSDKPIGLADLFLSNDNGHKVFNDALDKTFAYNKLILKKKEVNSELVTSLSKRRKTLNVDYSFTKKTLENRLKVESWLSRSFFNPLNRSTSVGLKIYQKPIF